ncbi:uncharacterized protein LOC143292801 [Babylonia areolata]|uniref:uncharacterized protein LOC143292801 n=1 Tax=Babylonia areolata TaxID=304850 RepID=UPI003FD58380
MCASRARGVGSSRLLRQLRKGFVVGALLLFVLALQGDVFHGPEIYGQETHRLTHLLLSSTQQHLQDKLVQRKLFHIPTKDIYLPAYFNLVDMESVSADKNGGVASTNCTLTKTSPVFHICVYPQELDIYISAALTTGGVWEPHITKLFQFALLKFPHSTFIDIGANIGYYSLLAASMGHQVMAVEPSPQNMKKLIQGIHVNKLANKIYVLQNAVAKSHRNVSLSVNSNNQGGIMVLEDKDPDHQTVQTIVLDDLLHLIDTPTAIIKMDIEGYECRGMATSAKLFHNVYVPYILMEWQQMYKHRHQMTAACPVSLIRQMTDYFVHLGYHAHEVRTGLALNPQRSTTAWQVGDVYWRHDDQPPLIPSL